MTAPALIGAVPRMGKSAALRPALASAARIPCMYCGNTGTVSGAPCPVCRPGALAALPVCRPINPGQQCGTAHRRQAIRRPAAPPRRH
jgi:hypothetical protein